MAAASTVQVAAVRVLGVRLAAEVPQRRAAQRAQRAAGAEDRAARLAGRGECP